MITIPVKCFSCGGVFQRKLTSVVTADNLNSVESTCFECHKRLEKIHADEYSRRLGLPNLKGSEKQTLWANPIRLKIVNELLTRLIDEFTTKNEYNKAKERLIRTLNNSEFLLAAYWINNRWNNYGIKQRLLRMATRHLETKDQKEEREAEEQKEKINQSQK
jgi:hypothetical protein